MREHITSGSNFAFILERRGRKVSIGGKAMKRTSYPIELRSTREDGTGEWVAIVPELPQFVSSGTTAQEALARIQAAMNSLPQQPQFTLDKLRLLQR